ncbi:MAG: flagellar protein FlaG [Candidatus Omnitrophota bacterium]|jgi:uncharacterized FlaG/YvyC family protein|nr:MAG: flagellar protein FlaG [Candidatus Omnitrophota bacterium]
MFVDAISNHGSVVMAVSGDDVQYPTIQQNSNADHHNGATSTRRFENTESSKKENSEMNSFLRTMPEIDSHQSRESDSVREARRLQFSRDKSTGRMAISIINAETQEVIREIPPENLLRVTEKLHQSLGLIMDRMM